MNVNFDFSGRVALVTGAASGIGRASAMTFARAGAAVAVADINAIHGREVVKTIAEGGGEAVFIPVDVSDDASVDKMVEAVIERFGRLDFAHNNAGIEGDHVPLVEQKTDNWRKVIDVNLSSVFYCMRAEIPAMLAYGGGAIVNTASASGLIGVYNLSSYTAAKHGVVGLTKAAAMEYAGQGVRINALCPGAIDTPFIAELPQPFRDRLLFGTPIGRLGQSEEMANAVLWLCSDAATYMTGHPLAVDGGVVLGGMGTRFDDLM